MDEKYIEERFKNTDKQLENHEKRLAKVEETYAIMKQKVLFLNIRRNYNEKKSDES